MEKGVRCVIVNVARRRGFRITTAVGRRVDSEREGTPTTGIIVAEYDTPCILAGRVKMPGVGSAAGVLCKYNINIQKKTLSKVTLYREIIPHRRLHIDRFAALINNAPLDKNPTLTPEEIAIKVDELEWSVVTRVGRGYDWYLRRHPNGRHAEEARKLSGQQRNRSKSEMSGEDYRGRSLSR